MTTPLDQHTAIALYLGYTFEDKQIIYDGESIKFRLWKSPSGGGMERNWPPNYPSDLNAMNEAVMSLPEDKIDSVLEFLYLVVLDDPKNTRNSTALATAEQWSKAFLLAVGKWEEP